MTREQDHLSDSDGDTDSRLADLLPNVQQFSAEHGPLFIEILGSAAAGKSTVIEHLQTGLGRLGYRVETIESYAQLAASPEGLHASRLGPLDPERTILTLLDTEAKLMALSAQRGIDLVIAECGPVDAEVFAELHVRRGMLSEDSRRRIVAFQRRPEFLGRLLTAIALCVPPEITWRRSPERSANTLSFRNRPENLLDYLRALDVVHADHDQAHFARLDSNKLQETVLSEVREVIASRLESLFLGDVLTIPRSILPDLHTSSSSYHSLTGKAAKKFMRTATREAFPRLRAAVEMDCDALQLVLAIVPVITSHGQTRVVLRHRTRPSRIQGLVAWEARHTSSVGSISDSIARGLEAFAAELDLEASGTSNEPFCIVYGGPGLSGRHVGCFWEGRVTSSFQMQGATTMPVLTAMASLSEPWSRLALSNLPCSAPKLFDLLKTPHVKS